ncbi:MAG: hypothetical protein E7557_09490 [Ruminococcaceae bacterium]|nr:hypothetical protein [Oscillospiraceae bacterium]
MFRKKEASGKIAKKRRTKYVYDPEYLSARKKKRITLITVFLCASLLFSNIYLKANYKETYIEYVLEKSFNDDFEYIDSNSGSWMSNKTAYYFKSQKFPDEKIGVSVNDKFIFWNYKRWRSNYISIKYKTQAQQELKELFHPIYGDCQVYLKPGYIRSEYNITNLSYDQYLKTCVNDSNISLIVTSSLDTKNTDIYSLTKVLKESNISLTNITIYYSKDKMNNDWLEKDEMARHSILYGFIHFCNGELESVDWQKWY